MDADPPQQREQRAGGMQRRIVRIHRLGHRRARHPVFAAVIASGRSQRNGCKIYQTFHLRVASRTAKRDRRDFVTRLVQGRCRQHTRIPMTPPIDPGPGSCSVPVVGSRIRRATDRAGIKQSDGYPIRDCRPVSPAPRLRCGAPNRISARGNQATLELGGQLLACDGWKIEGELGIFCYGRKAAFDPRQTKRIDNRILP